MTRCVTYNKKANEPGRICCHLKVGHSGDHSFE